MLSVADSPRENLSENLVWSASSTATTNPLPLRYNVGLSRGVRVEVSPSAPSWVYEVLSRFNRLLELPGNWDSYGARPVHPLAVVNTISFLVLAMRKETPCPHIVPTVEGDVQVEWHRNGVDIEIEICRDGRYDLSLDGGPESIEETGFVYDPQDHARRLHELFS